MSFLFLLLGGCSAAPAPRVAAPVGRSELVPHGYETLGTVRAECHARPPFGEIRGVPATSFACSRELLEETLEEQARARGATVLSRLRCSRRGEGVIGCTASLARPVSPPILVSGAPEPWSRDQIDPFLVSDVAIDLEPATARFARRSRTADDVTEFALLPVGHVELGTLRASCAAGVCDADQVRHGLRAAAGGLGATGLAGVRCFTLENVIECVATLSATERDPETDLAAR